MTELKKIGKYEVLRQIGKGSFGVVFEGRDPFLKRDVAIKVCTVNDDGLRRRFFREAEISGNLQHKNIVTVYAFGFEDDVPYLVQEFLAGDDLSQVIKQREALTSAEKLDYLLQVANGLAYAHQHGIIHRDIKPGNIRRMEDGHIKIMDFGIAKLASSETQLTQKGVTMGTASYLPPEQVRAEELDHRADIFSYGVLAYELLTYERPFRGNALSALVYQILYKVPLPVSAVWPDCPEELSDLVAKCLEKKPERRYQTMDELIPGLVTVRDGIEAGRWPALASVPASLPQPVDEADESEVLSQSVVSRAMKVAKKGKKRSDLTLGTQEAVARARKAVSAVPPGADIQSTQPVPRIALEESTDATDDAEDTAERKLLKREAAEISSLIQEGDLEKAMKQLEETLHHHQELTGTHHNLTGKEDPDPLPPPAAPKPPADQVPPTVMMPASEIAKTATPPAAKPAPSAAAKPAPPATKPPAGQVPPTVMMPANEIAKTPAKPPAVKSPSAPPAKAPPPKPAPPAGEVPPTVMMPASEIAKSPTAAAKADKGQDKDEAGKARKDAKPEKPAPQGPPAGQVPPTVMMPASQLAKPAAGGATSPPAADKAAKVTPPKATPPKARPPKAPEGPPAGQVPPTVMMPVSELAKTPEAKPPAVEIPNGAPAFPARPPVTKPPPSAPGAVEGSVRMDKRTFPKPPADHAAAEKTPAKPPSAKKEAAEEAPAKKDPTAAATAVAKKPPAAPRPVAPKPAATPPPAAAAPPAAATPAPAAPASEKEESSGLPTPAKAAGGSKRNLFIAAGAAAVLLLVVLGVVLLPGGDEPTPVAPPPPPPPPAVVETPSAEPILGVVALNAHPWGEITEIVNEDGYVQPLPQMPYTPIALSLIPGTYTITLQNPDFPDLQTCTIEVTTAVNEPCIVTFDEASVTEYFKESGWWQ